MQFAEGKSKRTVPPQRREIALPGDCLLRKHGRAMLVPTPASVRIGGRAMLVPTLASVRIGGRAMLVPTFRPKRAALVTSIVNCQLSTVNSTTPRTVTMHLSSASFPFIHNIIKKSQNPLVNVRNLWYNIWVITCIFLMERRRKYVFKRLYLGQNHCLSGRADDACDRVLFF
ncbi:MAG: hypothetical protein IKS21_07225 [Oscillospiraceae bacterium]|nr:hypothetical protein [Oscillospiraceae bacterium]